jgi:hypothetical protein
MHHARRCLPNSKPFIPREVGGYDELWEGLRERAANLGMTRIEIDERAGLPSGYSGKILGRAQCRHADRISLPLLLGALRLRLWLAPVDD